jgi:hypothetical protein
LTQFTNHVIPDPTVYLDEDLQSFRVGGREEAEMSGWVSMGEV